MQLTTLMENVPLFAELTAADRQTLRGAMSVETYADGHVFYREGDVVRAERGALYVIVEGKVLVTVDRHDASGFSVVRLMEPGEVFGLVALVDDGERAATCRAAGPVKAASLNRTVFRMLEASHGDLAMHFQMAIAGQLARDLRELDVQLQHAMIQGRIENRAARTLRV